MVMLPEIKIENKKEKMKLKKQAPFKIQPLKEFAKNQKYFIAAAVIVILLAFAPII